MKTNKAILFFIFLPLLRIPGIVWSAIPGFLIFLPFYPPPTVPKARKAPIGPFLFAPDMI